MDLDYIGKFIQVQSYKHDGSLHRTWDNAMIVEYCEDYIVIVSSTTKVIEGDGRKWYTREPAVSIFFFKEWFNVIAMLRENSIYYYCNIASPSLIDNHIIKYIDYDLDLKLLVDGEIIRLDEKEFEYHRKKYGYDDELYKVIRYVNEKVHKKMEDHVFPFVDQKIQQYYRSYLKIKDLQEKDILSN